MIALRVQMIELYLVFPYIKGRCRGNQLILVKCMNADWYCNGGRQRLNLDAVPIRPLIPSRNHTSRHTTRPRTGNPRVSPPLWGHGRAGVYPRDLTGWHEDKVSADAPHPEADRPHYGLLFLRIWRHVLWVNDATMRRSDWWKGGHACRRANSDKWLLVLGRVEVSKY